MSYSLCSRGCILHPKRSSNHPTQICQNSKPPEDSVLIANFSVVIALLVISIKTSHFLQESRFVGQVRSASIAGESNRRTWRDRISSAASVYRGLGMSTWNFIGIRPSSSLHLGINKITKLLLESECTYRSHS